MDENQALLAISLVARRAAIWTHDIMCSRASGDGKISAGAVDQFKLDIMAALAILDRPS